MIESWSVGAPASRLETDFAMSNTILAPFILLLIPGVLLLILGKSNQPTASQRKRLRSGGILCGIAFTYFGLATILGTKMSARPEVTGVIDGLRQYNGRRNQSSTFKVDYGGGETTDLTCGYNGTALREGETVFVRYLEFDHSILYLRVLSGPNAGWSLNVPADGWLGLIVIVIAGASFYAAYAYGRATERPPKP
jgi:hypothetical protein